MGLSFGRAEPPHRLDHLHALRPLGLESVDHGLERPPPRYPDDVAIGGGALEALRALSATELLNLSSRPGTPGFAITTDGYLFPKPIGEIYAAGEQADVPLLVG